MDSNDFLYNGFMERVLSGEQIAGKKIIKACQRHFDDLEKSKDPSFPFYFDDDWAEKYILFMKDLTLHEGKLAGQKFPMLPFQQWLVAMITGWRKKSNKKRRFREGYIQMAKKNAKTTLMAGLVLAIFYIEPDASGQYVFCADSREQANICFNMCKKFAENLKEEDEEINGVTEIFTKSITRNDYYSYIKSFPRDPKKSEGAGSNVVIVDEWHVHEKDNLKQSLKTGQIGREDPLLLNITTAGENIGGPCHQQYEYCETVLNGHASDDELFIAIWERDPDDDWKSRISLLKANPSIEAGGTPDLDATLLELKTAINRGGRFEQDYKTKVLNEWVSTMTVWIPHDNWMKCKVPEVKHQGPGFRGLDLAFKNDCVALVDYYPESCTFSREIWIPNWKLEDQADWVDYKAWNQLGLISIAGYDTIDYEEIEDYIKRTWRQNKIKAMYYDPYSAHQMGQNLEKAGLNVKPLPQSFGNLTPAIMEVERLVDSKKLKHLGDPVFNWMMSNVKIIQNESGYMKITKKHFKKKVDGPMALLMALNCATGEKIVKRTIEVRQYDSNGNLIQNINKDEA